jgi:hypothetical protein
VLIDANAATDKVAASVWMALRDRVLTANPARKATGA